MIVENQNEVIQISISRGNKGELPGRENFITNRIDTPPRVPILCLSSTTADCTSTRTACLSSIRVPLQAKLKSKKRDIAGLRSLQNTIAISFNTHVELMISMLSSKHLSISQLAFTTTRLTFRLSHGPRGGSIKPTIILNIIYCGRLGHRRIVQEPKNSGVKIQYSFKKQHLHNKHNRRAAPSNRPSAPGLDRTASAA